VRKIIVISLLLSFFVVLSPRSLWHNHNHDESKSSLHLTSEHTNQFEASDCFVCDFNLSLFTVQSAFVFEKYSNQVVSKPITKESIVNSDFYYCQPQRGPPYLM